MALPRMVWLVIFAMSAGAASLGLYLGNLDAPEEGEIIVHYADLYAAATGQPREDCHARPGRRAEVWLVVLCDGAAGRFAYPVGHDGALVEIVGEEA